MRIRYIKENILKRNREDFEELGGYAMYSYMFSKEDLEKMGENHGE